MLKQPRFWYQKNSIYAFLWKPFSWIWRFVSFLRWKMTHPYNASLPVICVGNLNMGGVGKTPIVQFLASSLQERNLKPVILSRGYGGSLRGPVMVDKQTAEEVGDEPLLLAKTAPVMVSRDRVKGLKTLEKENVDVVIMDDGLQNPTVKKHYQIIVIDGEIGLGNQQVFPAGPLRESQKALAKADLIVLIGEDSTDIAAMSSQPVVQCSVQASDLSACLGTPLVAFSGIGRPEKFFTMLRDNGQQLQATRSFGDHHYFTEHDLLTLSALAEQHKASLVTTMKDFMRLPEHFRSKVIPVDITLSWKTDFPFAAILSLCQNKDTQ